MPKIKDKSLLSLCVHLFTAYLSLEGIKFHGKSYTY